MNYKLNHVQTLSSTINKYEFKFKFNDNCFYTCPILYDDIYQHAIDTGGYSSEMPMSTNGHSKPAFFVCLLYFKGHLAKRSLFVYYNWRAVSTGVHGHSEPDFFVCLL